MNRIVVDDRRNSCFNGATTLGSWKTAALAARDGRRSDASMGPRRWGRGRRWLFRRSSTKDTGLQWGHDAGVVEDTGTCSTCWNTTRGFNGATTLGSWKTRHDRVDRSRRPGFNGATTLRSWKTPAVRGLGIRSVMLQWGHDAGVVEDADTGWSVRHEFQWLQWGHDAGVVEDAATCDRAGRARSRLQWGHDAGVVEDSCLP